MIHVQVRFFAALKEKTGYAMLNLLFFDSVSCAQLVDLLATEFESFASLLSRSLVAVDGEYIAPDRVLKGPRHEVAIYPPVSGGALCF